jgi:chloride channel protein, CIC family
VVFTLELTHAWGAGLPLLISSTAAYAFSALVLRRSVLTEKIARRGLHLTREYSTDPLETFFVREVMRPARAVAAGELAVHPDDTLRHVAYLFAEHGVTSAPVVQHGSGQEVIGEITLSDLLHARRHDLTEEHHRQRVLTLPLGGRSTPGAPASEPPGAHENAG